MEVWEAIALFCFYLLPAIFFIRKGIKERRRDMYSGWAEYIGFGIMPVGNFIFVGFYIMIHYRIRLK